jgi:uncharacterized protein YbdZ (MbtH family)
MKSKQIGNQAMNQNLPTLPLRSRLCLSVCILCLASLAAFPSAHATPQGTGVSGDREFVAAHGAVDWALVNVSYVLYNAGTRQTAIWYLINNALVSSGYGPSLPAGWQVAGVATNGSPGLDLYYLFDSVTRQTAIWHFSGASLLANYPGPTLPSGWALAGVRDFNGDGKLDFVLYNASTRQTALWYLNNNGVFTSGTFGPTLPAGWTLIGVADFNLDGYQDYLLLNNSDRRTAIWYLKNNTFLEGRYGPIIASGYKLIGAAEFNAPTPDVIHLDRYPDYLLSNEGDGRTAIWYLRNNAFAGSLFGPTVPAGWSLVALSEVGDPWDY